MSPFVKLTGEVSLGDLTVRTYVEPLKGRIMQEVCQTFYGTPHAVSRSILNTQEQAVYDALIELGWTPPDAKGSSTDK